MTSIQYPAPSSAFARPKSELVLASRDWIRMFSVVGALAVDVTMLLTAALLSAYLRTGRLGSGESGAFFFMIIPAYTLGCLAFDAYTLQTLKRSLRSAARANAALLVAAGFAFSAAFALKMGSKFSRLEIGWMLVFSSLLLTFGRTLGARGLALLRPAIEPSTFVIGDVSAASYGKNATRVINVHAMRWNASVDDPRSLEQVCTALRNADRVLLAFSDPRERAAWARLMRLTGFNVELLEPQLTRVKPIGLQHFAGAPTLVISRGPLSLPERVAKRGLDLACVALVAPAAIILVAVLAVLVKLESAGPCLFVQRRVGRNNRHYSCYKLRTMRTEMCDANGGLSTARGDRRVTTLGRFLRRTSLDELPQLWNVAVGDMSVVGPRPHALGSTAGGAPFWEAVSGYWSRHSVKPGLTGLAQIRGYRGATHSRRDLEDRLASDMEYVSSWSIWLDLKIILKTPIALLHSNAY